MARNDRECELDPVELVVLVSTAPIEPYPEVLRRGPGATWMHDRVRGVRIVTLQGLPIPGWRRPLSAIRERFRQLGPFKVDRVLAGRETMGVRAVDSMLHWAYSAHSSDLIGRIGRVVLRVFARALMLSEWMFAAARHRVVGLPSAVLSDDHVQVNRIQALANALSIQLAVLNLVLKELQPEAVLMVTSSTYVDVHRALAWHRSRSLSDADYASMPMMVAGRPFFSGGCTYMTSRGIGQILGARLAFGGVPNDVAQTRWMRREGITWADLPADSFEAVTRSEDECPLCLRADLIAIRCTSHFDRPAEARRMRRLYHGAHDSYDGSHHLEPAS